jgi:hypothetical protein
VAKEMLLEIPPWVALALESVTKRCAGVAVAVGAAGFVAVAGIDVAVATTFVAVSTTVDVAIVVAEVAAVVVLATVAVGLTAAVEDLPPPNAEATPPHAQARTNNPMPIRTGREKRRFGAGACGCGTHVGAG